MLQNPQHAWGCVRDEFAAQLRQPLCITLLRNCAATDAAAFQLAIKLLTAVMTKPKLRRVLKVGSKGGRRGGERGEVGRWRDGKEGKGEGRRVQHGGYGVYGVYLGPPTHTHTPSSPLASLRVCPAPSTRSLGPNISHTLHTVAPGHYQIPPLPPQAELGAFYPLFVLRPLETGRQDLPTLYTVLTSLKQVWIRVLV